MYKLYVQDNQTSMIVYTAIFESNKEAQKEGNRLVPDGEGGSKCFWVAEEKQKPTTKASWKFW